MGPKKRKAIPKAPVSAGPSRSPAVMAAKKLQKKYKHGPSPTKEADKRSRARRALYEVAVNKVSVRKAAQQFNLSYGFLQRRVSGNVEVEGHHGPPTVFTAAEERQFADYLCEMAKRGMGLRPGEFLDVIQEIVRKEGRKTPFTNGRPSYDWYRHFMNRHKDILGLRQEVLLESSRAKLTKSSLDNWYSSYRKFLVEKDLMDKPERIWNADESGFNLGSKAGKVIGPARATYKPQIPHVAGTSSKSRLTVMFCASAAGSIMPPFYVYPKPPPKGLNPLSCSLPGGKVEYTDKGWMDGTAFSKFLEHFDACIVTERPVLLLIDSVSSHINANIFQDARAKGIEMYRIVPNATHLMQPLDKGVFGPLKTQWYKTVRKHSREHPGVVINKANFAEKLRDAFNDFYRPRIVVNSFASSGIYPVNRSVISDEQLKTGLTFNAEDEQTQEDAGQQKNDSEIESINEQVFNTYVSVLKTPVKEKYRKRQEEGYDVQGASPGYDTYVLLRSKLVPDKHTQTQSRALEHPTEATSENPPESPGLPLEGLQLLADAALTLTPGYVIGNTDNEKLPEANSQSVSPVIAETLTLPKVKETQKKKRKSALDDLPCSLTSPESIRALSLKQLDTTKLFARKEKRAKAAYELQKEKEMKKSIPKKSTKSKARKSVKTSKKELVVQQENANEGKAKCMVCEFTWEEDETLMLGHTWIQCDKCQNWIHDHCMPIGMTYDDTDDNAEFICHECIQ